MTDALVPPIRPRAGSTGSGRQAPPRDEPRLAGPLHGRRVGPLPTPLRIHDLSESGCLVECCYDIPAGRRIALQIELPGEGWISVDAETLRPRHNVGFDVRFVDLSEANRGRIGRTIERLFERSRRAANTWGLGGS